MNIPADPTQHDWLTKQRNDAAGIFQAGIAAADPYQAVKRCLFARDNQFGIVSNFDDSSIIRQGKWTKIHLLAFGKAACMMAEAAQDIIPVQLLADKGIAVTNVENATTIHNVDVIAASHPLPNKAGHEGAKRVAEQALKAQQGELVLVLISGGGSALIPYPVDSVTLDEKTHTTELLLASGANINQINCVRKHLSQIKGGGLAKMAAPADLHALILSDVLGDDLSTIASGPTVPDDSTFQDAIAVFKSKQIWDKVPRSVQTLLEKGCQGDIQETPKPGNRLFARIGHTLIGSNLISVKALIKAASEKGYETRLYSDKLCGEARIEAEKLAMHVKQLIDQGIDTPIALLAGGETTVTLKGNGQGGRNQEMALAFALAAEQKGLAACWTFLSGGTDGRDGPTDAAGGLVDPGSISRMRAAGIDPSANLDNNDSYTALKYSQDLLDTGATGTNVADLQVLLIHPLS